MARPTSSTNPAEALFSAVSNTVTFGGNYERIKLEENQVSSMLVYTGKKVPVTLNNERGEETIMIPLAKIETTGELVTLPISAIFKKNFAAAEVKKGERFAMKRFPDTTKKNGAGKGKKMEVYAIAFPDRIATDAE